MRRRDRRVLHLAAGRLAHARDLPDKAHYLTDATGYIQGYLVAGARPAWLASPQGKDIATRWLRATIKGRDVAEKDFQGRRRLCQARSSV